MNVNELYISEDHFLLMFETKEQAEQLSPLLGSRWAFKDVPRTEGKNWSKMVAAGLGVSSPFENVEQEVRHMCDWWSKKFETKVTYLSPKEPILIAEKPTEEGCRPWQVIAGEKIGWIFCTHLVDLVKMKNNEK